MLLTPLYLWKYYMSRQPQLLFLLPRALKLTNSSNHQLANLLVPRLINSQTHQLTNSSTHKLTNSQTHQLTNSSTHKLTNSQTHQLTNSQTHQLTNSQTHQLTNLPVYILIRCTSLLCYQCVKKLKNLHRGSIFFLKRLAWYLKKPYLCIRFRERSSLGAIEKEFIERFT